MNLQKGSYTPKGYEFEHEVEKILRRLEESFPDRVKVTAQREFPDAARPHRADFEFEYKIGGLVHQHLIECQNRTRSSHEIADKIYAVRGTTDRNRYILVYRDHDYLSAAVEKRLTEMGVLHFDIKGFEEDFLKKLSTDLTLRELGQSVISNHPSWKFAKPLKTPENLGINKSEPIGKMPSLFLENRPAANNESLITQFRASSRIEFAEDLIKNYKIDKDQIKKLDDRLDLRLPGKVDKAMKSG